MTDRKQPADACKQCGWDHETKPIPFVGDRVLSETYGRGQVSNVQTNQLGCLFFSVVTDEPESRTLPGIPLYGWKLAPTFVLSQLTSQIGDADTSTVLLAFLDIANDRLSEWPPQLRWASLEERRMHTTTLRREIDRRIPIPKRVRPN